MTGVGWVPGAGCAGGGVRGPIRVTRDGTGLPPRAFPQAVHALLAGGPGMTRAAAVGVTFAGNPS